MQQFRIKPRLIHHYKLPQWIHLLLINVIAQADIKDTDLFIKENDIFMDISAIVPPF